MVTGIEAAGLVLGLFPLVIEGIEFYINSAETVKEIMRHKRTLDEFRRELEMEKCIFDNIYLTLEGRAGGSNTEGVLPYLPPCFDDGCQELNTILRNLMENFQKYGQDVAGYRKMFIMLRHFKSKDRKQCIERIHRLNFNLDKLVNGAQKAAALEANKLRKDVARHYQRVRKHAIILYSALKERLQISSCQCKKPHSANLQLDVCILGRYNNSHNIRLPKTSRLSLLFPVSAEQEGYLTLRELEFENLDSPLDELSIVEQGPITLQLDTAYLASEQKTYPEHTLSISSTLEYVSNIQRPRSPLEKKRKKVGFRLPAAKSHSCIQSPPAASTPERIIQCFCSTIRNITNMCTCVGVLVSGSSKHKVWVPTAPLAVLESSRVVSLAELLSQPGPPRIERLKLAVKLASSVLQLHTTKWLQERWGKQNIYFIQGNSSQPSSLSLETPVVRQAFTTESSVSEALIEPSRMISCNLSLFSLGIVLIELWFWRHLESFPSEQSQASNCPEDLDTARFITAKGLIGRLYEDAGNSYGESARRCINGIDHKETQLENNEFKNEAYLKVLQPLEKHLEFFCYGPS